MPALESKQPVQPVHEQTAADHERVSDLGRQEDTPSPRRTVSRGITADGHGEGKSFHHDFSMIPNQSSNQGALKAEPMIQDDPSAERQAEQWAGKMLHRTDTGSIGQGDDFGQTPGASLNAMSPDHSKLNSAEAHQIQEILNRGGRMMGGKLRTEMETHFGRDFSRVRLHTDSSAHRSARSLKAQAYTVGQDIVFGPGRFAPSTPHGRRLLAHELVHTIQQSQPGAPQGVQRSPEDDPQSQQGVTFKFSVHLQSKLNSQQLLIEFIKQYRKVGTDAEAEELRKKENWQWEKKAPEVTEEHVKKGYILITVTDNSLTPQSAQERQAGRGYFRRLSPRQQTQINVEANRQFWEKTQFKVGQRLGGSKDDQAMARYWMMIRDQLIQDRRAIDALPKEIKQFIFDKNARRVLQPGDYRTALRIAQKLAGLTPEELAEYKARVTAETTDWNDFEQSVERYLEEKQRRQELAAEREKLKTKLYGLKELYLKWKDYKSIRSSARFIPSVDESGVRDPNKALIEESADRHEADLRTGLAGHGFSSIIEFERTIDEFEGVFEQEALLVAREMLDRYDHMLFEQEKRYQKASEAHDLYRQLQGTKARQHYQEAERQRELASMILPDPDLHRYLPSELKMKTEHREKRRQATSQAKSEVGRVAGAHPVLSGQGAPTEEIATASSKGIQAVVLGHLKKKRQSVEDIREDLASDQDLIYDMDVLLQQTYLRLGIKPDSIYDLIIKDRRSEVKNDQVLVGIIVAILAIGAGLLTAGGGTVAVLGATAAAGLGAYQAVEEYRRYAAQKDAHEAGLLSQDPSIAWVVLAVVGAAVDMGAALAAIKALRPVVKTLETTGDMAAFEAKVTKMSQIDQRIQQNVIRAAKAEAKAKKAWKQVLRPPTVLRVVIVPGAEEFGRLVYAVYLSARRGIISFENFILTRQAQALLGDVSTFSPKQLTGLKTGFTQASSDWQRIFSHGKALGLAEEEIGEYLRLWALRGKGDVNKAISGLDEWAGPLQRQAKARFRQAPEMMTDPKTRQSLTEFDRRIAGTGGIEKIEARPTTEGGLSVSIEGEALPGMTRKAPKGGAAPGQRIAPNFNRSGKVFTRKELGLGKDWERLHLWGPGFGDEAAAGMMMGPKAVNQVWQNKGVEDYIRLLGEQARKEGGRVRVRATAVSWPDPTPSGWTAPKGERFLKQAEYKITLELPGEHPKVIRATIDVPEPPATSGVKLSIDPPNAESPANLLPVK